MNTTHPDSSSLDLLCIGTALVDSLVLGFDPNPVSASGFRAKGGSLVPGGEAVNGAVGATNPLLRPHPVCASDLYQL